MDVEKLSKNQIILLTLLVSFVTSIATGIVTVSLMDQAPPAVAETVNRIVERTVEKVVPSTQSAAAAETTKTVIVKESDLIAQAAASVQPSIVHLYSSDPDAPEFLGIGIVLNKSGAIVVDTNALGDAADVNADIGNDVHVRAFVTRRDADSNLAYLQAATSTSDGKSVVWIPATLGSSPATLGESVFMVSGKMIPRIEDGIVTALIPLDAGYPIIETNVPSDQIMAGSPLVDTDGNIIGISTGIARASSPAGFTPVSLVSLQAKPAPKTPPAPAQ